MSKLSPVKRLIFWLIAFPFLVLFQILSKPNNGFATTICTIPGTTTSCGKLVSGLPWQFSIEERENRYILFKSPIGTQQPGMQLKISLEVSNYISQEAAAEAFYKICKKADPDMGISYGWDLVTVREEKIFYLHADCTLAEQHFDSVVHSLEKIVGASGNHMPLSLICRCGGGCKSSE